MSKISVFQISAIKWFWLLSAFVLMVAPLLRAEDGTRSCRIVFPGRGPTDPQKLHLFDGKISQLVELPDMNFSPVYKLPAGPLTMSLLANPLDDPEKLPAGTPSVAIAAETTDFYLIIFSDPENEVTPVRMRIVDVGAQKMQAGQMLWMNLTAYNIEGKLGSEKVELGPEALTLVTPPRNDPGEYPVSISYRLKDQESALPLFETRWTYQPTVRQFSLIYEQKPESRRPTVVAYPDFRPSN